MTSAPLFTPRFFLMCGFTFTVFLSAFQLLPTAPFRILALGGTAATAGLFLGFLTYASALTAPITGTLADRLGKRRILIVSSSVIAAISVVYAVLEDYRLMLALVVLHGVFWSGLLSASAAYITDIVPAERRAEGLSWWGLSTVVAVAVAPTIGLWIYGSGGWLVMCLVAAGLNVAMGVMAWSLPPEPQRPPGAMRTALAGRLVDWRVLALSGTLFLYSFGYGSITSFVALYADANGVTPRALYFAVFSVAILFTRPFAARLGDRFGYRKILLPCLVLIAAGFGLLALGGGRSTFVASALVFGTGFGSAYPLFAAYVMRRVDDGRRGAAFGSILAAFDTGIGTGSIGVGWIVEHYGFQAGYGVATALAVCAIPYFLLMDRWQKRVLSDQ
ncbi:MAG: MFS transporter [Vicinamibacteria bacterium]